MMFQAQQQSNSAGLAIFDIDNFKRINDQYGHDVGDKAIVHIVKVVQSMLGDNDFIARMGGEEFAILMINQELEQVESKVKQICQCIAESPFSFTNTESVTLTVSMGCVYYDELPFKDFSLVLPDRLMYQAKHSGKNQVVIETVY